MTWSESRWASTVSEWMSQTPTRAAPMRCREQVASSLVGHLESLGFDVALSRVEGLAPTILATRGLSLGRPTLGIYNHYDVEPPSGDWRTDPSELVLDRERYFGAGVADNLGALALRVLAARCVRDWPAVLWVIEGGEEEGSPALDAVVSVVRDAQPSVWVDETGFFVGVHAQRMLCIERDHPIECAVRVVEAVANGAGLGVLRERRVMNRVSPAGAARVEALMGCASYLALGPNDELANIHSPNESLPRWTLAPSAAQWVTLLQTIEEG